MNFGAAPTRHEKKVGSCLQEHQGVVLAVTNDFESAELQYLFELPVTGPASLFDGFSDGSPSSTNKERTGCSSVRETKQVLSAPEAITVKATVGVQGQVNDRQRFPTVVPTPIMAAFGLNACFRFSSRSVFRSRFWVCLGVVPVKQT